MSGIGIRNSKRFASGFGARSGAGFGVRVVRHWRAALVTGVAAALVVAALPAVASVTAGAKKWQAGDWKGAVAEWVGPAAEGNADALFNMGQAYRLGRGVEQNHALALEYYERAANKGHLAATANLGIVLFQDGKRTKALPYLRHAADAGEKRAAYVLGVAMFNGDGAPRNQTLGYAYVLRSRDLGLAEGSQQAARMATLLTPTERAQGEAAAAAIASGRPVPVDLPATGIETRAGPARPAPEAKPAPVAATPATPAAGTAGKGYYVQLGAFSNEGAARQAWARLVAQSGHLVRGETPQFAPKGRLVALQIGPFAGRDAARTLCAQLAAASHACFVTRN